MQDKAKTKKKPNWVLNAGKGYKRIVSLYLAWHW